jgi:hypothetical protein
MLLALAVFTISGAFARSTLQFLSLSTPSGVGAPRPVNATFSTGSAGRSAAARDLVARLVDASTFTVMLGRLSPRLDGDPLSSGVVNFAGSTHLLRPEFPKGAVAMTTGWVGFAARVTSASSKAVGHETAFSTSSPHIQGSRDAQTLTFWLMPK